MMARFRRLRLLGVDTWAPPPTTVRRWWRHTMQGCAGGYAAAHAHAIEITRPYAHRCQLLHGESIRAAEFVGDLHLDFAFLDACHAYDSVRTDLIAWFPKVRLGGIIAGHDYDGAGDRRGLFGVKRAVDQFFGGVPLRGRSKVWYLVKSSRDPRQCVIKAAHGS